MIHVSGARWLILIVIALTLVGGGDSTRAASRPGSPSHAAGLGAYYLSLGDSLAFGYQPYKPLVTGFGYTDVLAQEFEAINPDLTPVNLGCPGETTVTFMKGGCQGAAALRYTGSQLDNALKFLKAHPGQVNPITIAVGAVDLLQSVQAVTDTAQITTTALNSLQVVYTNLNTIFKKLRQAAPKADIVTIDFFDPLTVALTPTVALDTVPAITILNSDINAAAATSKIKVADMFTTFNTPPANPLLCSLTWMCGSFNDVDPTTLGYKVMADIFAKTLGYPGLSSGPSVTNPVAITHGLPVATGGLQWLWIGDENAAHYDIVVYHYGGKAVVIDKSTTVAAATRSYTFSGTKCGVTYFLRIRSHGAHGPARFFAPADGTRALCAPVATSTPRTTQTSMASATSVSASPTPTATQTPKPAQ